MSRAGAKRGTAAGARPGGASAGTATAASWAQWGGWACWGTPRARWPPSPAAARARWVGSCGELSNQPWTGVWGVSVDDGVLGIRWRQRVDGDWRQRDHTHGNETSAI
jgi:hypothetical protein